MFERFTDRARRVFTLATENARLLNDNHLGNEHILLGLIQEGEGVAARVLTDLGFTYDDILDQVQKDEVVNAGEKYEGVVPFTPRAKRTLELALREALQLGHNYIGTEHILLSLVRDGVQNGEGLATQILRSRASLDDVSRAVLKALNGSETAQEAEPKQSPTRWLEVRVRELQPHLDGFREIPKTYRFDVEKVEDDGWNAFGMYFVELAGKELQYFNASRLESIHIDPEAVDTDD